MARRYHMEADERKDDGALAADDPAGEVVPPFTTVAYWPELEAVIGPGGMLARHLPGFERRSGQELMMRAVAGALEHARRLVVEAGTGIGKSLAYLLPAAVSGRRVMVSTGTKALQDQLALRQVPFIRDTLGIPVEVAILKGRANYLCLLLLDQAASDPRMALDLHDDHARIRQWSETTQTGDRAELADVADDAPAWRAVAADAERCLGRACGRFDECFLMRARRAAEAADLVIVNHHLFFADLALRDDAGFALLPDADAVVFDEAHHIEDVAGAAFGRAVSDVRVVRLGRDAKRALEIAGKDAGRVASNVAELERDAERLWSGLQRVVEGRQRIDLKTLDAGVIDAWWKLDNSLLGLATMVANDGKSDERVARIGARVDGLRADLAAMFDPAEETVVRWIDRGPRATFLRATPIRVGPKLADTLYPRFPTIIWTSATLSAGGSFEHVRARWGLAEGDAEELVLASPFDYARQAILYTPSDLPDPQDPRSGPASWPRIEALVGLTEGRALLLFTSRKKMLEAHAALAGRWSWPTLVQGEGPKERLVERFLASPGSVLFATQTFWEGIDVIGPALSLVVIDKLPFAAPGEPVIDARVAELTAAGKNAFMDYQVPTAILALKQGFGRLIRHRDDRGIVAILDPRLTTARYGKAFATSLPPARRTGDLEEVARWWRELDASAAKNPDQNDPEDAT